MIGTCKILSKNNNFSVKFAPCRSGIHRPIATSVWEHVVSVGPSISYDIIDFYGTCAIEPQRAVINIYSQKPDEFSH